MLGIIGGSGFVGRHIAARAAALGMQVTIPTRQREKLKAELILRTYEPKTQKYIDTPVSSLSLATNDGGEVSAEFPPTKRGGSFLVRVSEIGRAHV